MAKEYKPGQLITINRKVYRIAKEKGIGIHLMCNCCAFKQQNHLSYPCWECTVCDIFPSNCYFKLVKL